MNTEVSITQRTNHDNDASQYAASVALDDVLAVFVDDGYTEDDLRDLIDGKLDDLYREADE